MARNTLPVFAGAPQVEWDSGGAALTTGNVTKDGTSGTLHTVFTAGADGSLLEKIVFQPIGGNVATACRIFVNNGGSTGTAANNNLIDQFSLPLVTGFVETAGAIPIERYLNLRLPAGYRILVAIGTTVASGWRITGVGQSFTA